MKLRTLRDASIKRGMRVLVRADFNEPVSNGKVSDDFRIKTTLPTIKYLLKKGAKVILISHLGRPNGKADSTLSLAPVASRLSRLLKRRVILIRNIWKS